MLKLLRDAFYFCTSTVCIGTVFYGIIVGIATANFCFCVANCVFANIASGASLAENGNDGKCGDYSFHTSNV